MDNYITPRDLAFFLIFLVVIALGVLLCIALVKLIALIKRISDMIDTNRPQIDSTLKVLPDTLGNINVAAAEIGSTVGKAGEVIDNFSGKNSDVAVSVEDTVEQVLAIVKGAINAFNVIKDLFNSKFK